MIGPKKVESPTMTEIQNVVAELLPDHVNHFTNQLFGFVKEFKNDPYAGACTVAAKLGHFASKIVLVTTTTTLCFILTNDLTWFTANGEMPGGHLFPPSPRQFDSSKESSPSRNGDGNQSFHSDGMDADYTTNEEGYEVIFKPEKRGFELPPRPETFRGQPLNQEQWLNYMDNEGRVTNIQEIKNIVFRGVLLSLSLLSHDCNTVFINLSFVGN